MRFNILSDTHWESKVDQVLDELSGSGYRRNFEEKDYGPGMVGLTVVFMCQNPELNLKRRVKFAKKEKKLYLDIMLDLHNMRAANPELRKKIVAERLLNEVPPIISKYKIDQFDSPRFISDFKEWILRTGWIDK